MHAREAGPHDVLRVVVQQERAAEARRNLDTLLDLEIPENVEAPDEVSPDAERHREAMDRPPRVLNVDPVVMVLPMGVDGLERARHERAGERDRLRSSCCSGLSASPIARSTRRDR